MMVARVDGAGAGSAKSPAATAALPDTLRDLFGGGRAYMFALVAVVLLGLAIRIALIAETAPVTVSDARDYLVLARNLA